MQLTDKEKRYALAIATRSSINFITNFSQQLQMKSDTCDAVNPAITLRSLAAKLMKMQEIQFAYEQKLQSDLTAIN